METNNPNPCAQTTSENADNLNELKTVISEYFDKIADCFNDDELKTNYTKKDGEMNWVKLRTIFRKQLSADLKDEWNEMWEDEKLTEKLTKLKNMIENSSDTTRTAWRPKVGDIKPQSLSLEKMRLLSEKEQLKIRLKKKQEKVDALKSQLSKKWEDFRLLDISVQEHRVKLINHADDINSQFENFYKSYNDQIPTSENTAALETIQISTEMIHPPIQENLD